MEIGATDASTADDRVDAAVVSYRAAVLADKPITYLRFGERSGTLAGGETGNGNSGNVSGTVLWGEPGAIVSDEDTAVRLDGETSLIDLGGKIDFAGTNPFSIEIWFNAATVDATYRFLVLKDNRPSSGREEWAVAIRNADGLFFERYVAGEGLSPHPPAPTPGRWVYSVATYDGTGLTLFVDGAPVERITDTRTQLAKNVPLYVGGNTSGNNVFDGALDELAIYDHALSEDRIKAHFDAAKSSPKYDLVPVRAVASRGDQTRGAHPRRRARAPLQAAAKKSGEGGKLHAGAVTFVQRFGSSLNLTSICTRARSTACTSKVTTGRRHVSCRRRRRVVPSSTC